MSILLLLGTALYSQNRWDRVSLTPVELSLDNGKTLRYVDFNLPCKDILYYQLNGDSESIVKEIDRFLDNTGNRLPNVKTVRWQGQLMCDLKAVVGDLITRDSLSTGGVLRQQVEDLIFITIKDDTRNLFVVAHGNSLDFGRNVKDIVVGDISDGKEFLKQLDDYLKEL